MNLEPTLDAELASAALDNEVTDADRARLEADKVLSAELSTYQQLHVQLSQVAIPAEAREMSIAAALAVFDDQQETGPMPVSVPSSTPVTSLARHRYRRQQQYKWLGAVAAVSMFAFASVALLNGARGNDKAASTASEPLGAPAAEPTAKVAGADAGLPQLETTSNTELFPAEDAPAATDAAFGPAAGATEAPVGIDVATGPALVSAWAAAPSINSEAELIAFVNSAASFPVNDTAPGFENAPSTDAPSAALVGQCFPSSDPALPVVYRGREVYVVVVDPQTLSVIDPISCSMEQIVIP